MSNVSTLNVLVHGDFVGTMTHVGGDRTLFAFTEDYIENPAGRAVLSLGFKDSLGGLLTEFRPYQTRLMPFFSNLLPEGHLRDYLAGRAGVKPEREFFLLWALGQDLPGAVTVVPADGEELPPGKQAPLKTNNQEGDSGPLRFSLAGVQLKLSAVQQATGGLTIPANGVGGEWIIKLPSTTYSNVPENEFSMMELARMIGIDVPQVKLVDIDDIENLPRGIGRFGKRAFVIRRFDREPDGGKVHIEDFAQVFGVYPADKYKKASMRNIASVLAAEGSETDIKEFVRRLVFNALIGNADMHLKNWSLIYRDGQTASIAPAYDFVSTIAYIDDKEAALKVSQSKRFDEFSVEELKHMAAKARIAEKPVIDTAMETVQRFHEAWKKDKANLEFDKNVIAAIDRHLATVPLDR